jgi:hypothetical protein
MTPQIRRLRIRWLATILAVFAVSVAAQSPQAPKTGSPPGSKPSRLLEIVGEVAHPISFTAAEFAKLPRRTVRAKGHDGIESGFQGVPLIDILAKAGVSTGKAIRGPALSVFVVVEASDGYRGLRPLRARSGVHRSSHPAGRSPGRNAAAKPGRVAPGHRIRRE